MKRMIVNSADTFSGSFLEFNWPAVYNKLSSDQDCLRRLEDEVEENINRISSIRLRNGSIIISRFTNRGGPRSTDTVYEVHSKDSSFKSEGADEVFKTYREAVDYC